MVLQFNHNHDVNKLLLKKAYRERRWTSRREINGKNYTVGQNDIQPAANKPPLYISISDDYHIEVRV